MNIKIIDGQISRKELEEIADHQFGNWVKAVVDITRGIIAIGGDLHADEEAVLLENGSQQEDLWGVNLRLAENDDERIEFDSMINVRPRQGNRTRNIESQEIREKIRAIVDEHVVW
ncbi:MAG: DUF5674 family protein [Candidatus Sungbacteria bacterium]|nr:DUF5674 family protein [bacterium]MDZ4260042.1 DUF5674 family protein [Candidatus Sungbacteria bacterium]